MTDAHRSIDQKRLDTRGTTAIVVATAFSAAAVLVYEVIAGRALGTDGFAPIGVLWTVGFIVFTVLMLPVEQFITRTLVLGGGAAGAVVRHVRLIATVFACAIVAGSAFTAATVDRFFAGQGEFIAVVATLLVTRAALATARGFLAGRRRFFSYGLAVGMEGSVLVIGAALAALAGWGAPAYGWAMALAPLTVFALAPFRHRGEPTAASEETVSASLFLGWLLVATAAAQIVLAGGPIVVGAIGGTPAAVSVFFVTFTLFRGPITSAYNLVARVLPDFTAMVAHGRHADLHRWAWRLVGGGIAFAAAAMVGGATLGPPIIRIILGAEYEPSALVAGLGGAGVGAGLAVLFVHQIFVARANTRALAFMWIAALVVAGLVVALAPGEPIDRVAAGFASGELAALVLLGWTAAQR